MMAKRQWKATDGGIYGLDLTAVFRLADAMKMKVDAEFVLRVCAYEDEAVALFQKTKDVCTEEDREHCRQQFGEDNFMWACKQCADMKMKKRTEHG